MAVLALLCVGLAVVLSWIARKGQQWCAQMEQEFQKPAKMTLENPTTTDPVVAPSIFDEPAKSLSVILPAYNEQDRLPDAMAELMSYLEKRRDREGPSFTYEVIIVDDGSRDNTVRVAYDLVRKYGFDAVRLLRSPGNKGKGHAVKQGVLIARGELVLFADADGATKVSEMEPLEAALRKAATSGEEVVSSNAAVRRGLVGGAVGSRAHLEKAAAAQRSPLRNLLTTGFHVLVMLVAGSAIRDTQCGFKMFSRRAAGMLYGNQRLQRWCFDVELIYLAQQLGVPLAEVQVEWTEMPGSKIRFTSIVSMFLELVAVKVSYQILGWWKIYSEAELITKAK